MVTVLTMVITFIATGIDEMLVLILLFAQAQNQKQVRNVYAGQQIGMTILLVITILAVYGITLVTGKWIGLLGFLPIVLGLIALFGEEEDDEEEIVKKTAIFSSFTVRVALIAIAGGAEELAIYIPYFSSLESKEIFIATITFILMVPIWSTFCKIVSSFNNINNLVEKYQRIVIPVVFIGIGLNILVESNTIMAILELFHLI